MKFQTGLSGHHGSLILDRLFETFKEGLTPEQFRTKVDALNEKKDNFVRAGLLYQQALKCKDCEPNVSMMLLCSCADSMKLVGRKKSRENFKKFYKEYSPIASSNPPIKYYLDANPSSYSDASFEEALDYIYVRFRSLYTHEGRGLLELPKGDSLIGYELMDKLEETSDKCYVIDILKILNWFATMTKDSLRNILSHQKRTT